MSLPKVRCARCNKMVNALETYDDPSEDAVVIRVWCHGESDEMRIEKGALSPSEMKKMLGDTVGVAFQPALDAKRQIGGPS